MDGSLGHGKKVYSKSKDTIEETKIKDDWKDEQALFHGLQVIRIEADKSELEYLKPNIINALKDIFDLSNIDWNVCNMEAHKNIVKIICTYYEKDKQKGVMELAREFHLDRTTVRKYLKIGREIGWCTYDVNESLVIRDINKVLARNRTPNELTKKIVERYKSNMKPKEIAKLLNIDVCTLWRHLKKSCCA
jgi:hypothetical protein